MLRLEKLLFVILRRRLNFAKTFGKKNQVSITAKLSNKAVVGSFNYFAGGARIDNCVIGNYCSFAPNVAIGLGEHQVSALTTSVRVATMVSNYSLHLEPTIIGNDVWIGANSVVRQGVKIGDGAIIGAGCFVNSDIPAYTIAVGSPARVKSNRFNQEIIDALHASRWYDQQPSEAAILLREINAKYF